MKQRLKTLMKLAVWTSIAMYFANKLIESSASVENLLKTYPDHFFEWRHGKIYYTKKGSGSPVLLIHDLYPSSSQQEWGSIINLLSEDHTVYAVDLLGCGRSDKPFITYTAYLFVELLKEFTEEIIGEKTDIIATGKSSVFALMAAKLYSNLFGKLTFVNPESPNQLASIPDLRTKTVKAILDCPILGVSLYYLLTCRSQIEYDFSEKYFYNPFYIKDKTMHAYYESAHLSNGGGRHLMASIKGNYVNLDIRFALSNVDGIHLIFGSEYKNSQNIANAYKKLNPSVCYSFVEKTKMLPQMEAPEKFVAAL